MGQCTDCTWPHFIWALVAGTRTVRTGPHKPWKFNHLTVNHVYAPLANSHGHILELTRAQRANSGQERRKRLHQFLSDIGVKALRQHLGQLLGIAQVSRDQNEYEGHVRRIFSLQYEMDLR
jgi:hypothetical protein